MQDFYPNAQLMLVPDANTFTSNAALAIVQHSTGGDMTLQMVYDTFIATKRSTHFAVDLQGNVAQYVPLTRGAGGNCCPEPSYSGYDASFWNPIADNYPNLNMATISIEHCNNGSQSLTMTPQQMDASNKLTLWCCQQAGLTSDKIKGHDSINAVNCPGSVFYNTYWQQMVDYVNKGLQPMVTNPNIAAQFAAKWQAGGGVVGTGIYTKLLNWWQSTDPNKLRLDYPSGGEGDAVDYNGNPIKVQCVNGYDVEWNNGTLGVYDSHARAVVVL